jgi:glycosyltransferase involved in cell wall biosynthesis
MKIALAMIVKGSDSEARVLDRCLHSLRHHVDGIFITRTHKPGELPNLAVGKIAHKYNATLSEFEWCNDFSKARNFNFSQVPSDFDYIMWTDADDIWRSMEKLRPILESNPSLDAFAFWYLYDWDEFKRPVVVHKKTMIIKNDGCANWVGAIHEDLEPTRSLEVHLIEGIDRLHLTDQTRIEEAGKRNVEIATLEAVTKPDDPRSFWNLANSQFAVADYAASTKSFKDFIALSHSEDEKYLAYTRLADIQKSLGNQEEAIRNLQTAIGIAPALPDAFLQLGYNYFVYGDYDKAEEYVLQGMVRRPQINKMIVYNPRDYDYNPMMLLAKIYYSKNRPDLMLPLLKGCLKIYPDDAKLQKMVKEGTQDKNALGRALTKVQELRKIRSKDKLKIAIEKLPIDLRSHPSVVMLRNAMFIKETSSGKDMVIYCGNTHAQWNPELFKTKGFGGSEEAVIHLARQYGLMGWNVTVYNNCGHKAMKEVLPTGDGIGTVTYVPFWEFNYRDKQDVMILWRWLKPLDAEINCPKIYVDLHDVIGKGEFTEKRLAKITKVFVKTKFHRSLFPNVPDEKITVIPNGMQLYHEGKPKKDKYLIINTSSPDRSLDVLPAIFKKIKEKIPDARMQWAYGWDNFKSFYATDQKKLQWMRDTQKAMEEAGIEDLGRLTQAEVGKLYAKANIFAYPTEFAEIDCISVKKAQAAGCVAVTTDFGALKESNKFGMTVHSKKTKDNWNAPYQFHFGITDEKLQDEFAETVVAAFNIGFQAEAGEVEVWTKTFEWESIAKRWDKIFRA